MQTRLARRLTAAFALACLCALPLPAQVAPVALEELVTTTSAPIGIVNAGDGSGWLFFVEQPGVIEIWDGTQLLSPPFLDIRDRVGDGGSEQGLLGLAFHPDYPDNGFFYVNYTDNSGDTVVSRFSRIDADTADPASEMLLLGLDQPFSNHNGGHVAFGPDGYLHIATGDGGSGGDPDNRAQTLTDPLGKLLRIDVDGDDFPGDPERNYAIPPDNPFVGDPDALDEIWAYGLRNPWKFSFDRATADLFIGDVGQNTLEEIDFEPASSAGGENYGWRLMEGSECFDPPTDCNDGTLVLPILEYRHFQDGSFIGCSVTGGFRYRGSRNPMLVGRYFYGDYCTGRIWAAVESGGDWDSGDPSDTSLSITAWGEDEAGELYVADVGTNTIYRVFDDRPFCDVETSQAVYVDGEVITAEVLRLVNHSGGAVTLRAQLAVISPSGALVPILNQMVSLPDGSDNDIGPRELKEVDPALPRGTYELVCRLVDDDAGVEVASDRVAFEVE